MGQRAGTLAHRRRRVSAAALTLRGIHSPPSQRDYPTCPIQQACLQGYPAVAYLFLVSTLKTTCALEPDLQEE
jgi:hypothetical protein